MTISHSQATPQVVTFYDRDGAQLAQYLVHPTRSPSETSFANRAVFAFDNGLLINTGNCSVNLVVVY